MTSKKGFCIASYANTPFFRPSHCTTLCERDSYRTCESLVQIFVLFTDLLTLFDILKVKILNNYTYTDKSIILTVPSRSGDAKSEQLRSVEEIRILSYYIQDKITACRLVSRRDIFVIFSRNAISV